MKNFTVSIILFIMVELISGSHTTLGLVWIWRFALNKRVESENGGVLDLKEHLMSSKGLYFSVISEDFSVDTIGRSGHTVE